jgi:hypothetical protein
MVRRQATESERCTGDSGRCPFPRRIDPSAGHAPRATLALGPRSSAIPGIRVIHHSHSRAAGAFQLHWSLFELRKADHRSHAHLCTYGTPAGGKRMVAIRHRDGRKRNTRADDASRAITAEISAVIRDRPRHSRQSRLGALQLLLPYRQQHCVDDDDDSEHCAQHCRSRCDQGDCCHE